VSKPLVSVVVPSLNRAAVIRPTLESILSQDYGNIECIVMDGGSTDGTVEILRSYGERIRWVSERDKGQADAIDRGLRRSRGEICTWLNADDLWWGPSIISRVVAEFEGDPGLDVLYGDCVAVDLEGREVAKSYVVPNWTLQYAVENADHCIPQPASFIRRRALERVGFLDTSKIFMDWDLWLRIGIDGRIRHIPVTLAAAREYEHHWHKRHRAAAREWVATVAAALADPRMPAEIKANGGKALVNAYMRAMRFRVLGGGLTETLMFGLKAARYDSEIISAVIKSTRGFAEEQGRPLAAARLDRLLNRWETVRDYWRRARRRARRIGSRFQSR